jgi:tRNA pseudouridine38-40 synthase
VTIRVRIDLGYDGSDFTGSQRQPGGRTIQSEVERALQELTGQATTVAFAGRTDRGVHAVGQVASADVAWHRGEESLQSGLQALTPDDIAIYSVRQVEREFHARFSALSREYRYRVWNGPGSAKPVLLRRLVWHVRREIDVDLMAQAAALLTGQQDVRSFAGLGAGTPTSARDTVRQIVRSAVAELDGQLDRRQDAKLIEYRIEANGFLPYMVRNIVGSLVETGSGRQTVDAFQELLSRRDRRSAPAGAPPHGLVLWRVRYEQETA